MDKKPQTFSVPLEGSLGLLALGADGLRAWRLRKAQAEEESMKEEEDAQ